MDYTPLNSIRLREAFGDLQTFQSVKCDNDYLTELFEWTVRGTVFIYDDAGTGHSIFVTDTNGLGTDKTFRIDNPYHKDLFLWHIDGVLYRKDSKCDCAFLSEKRIGFVEFKANAANNTETAIKENYEKASSQLKLTITDVVDRCKNIGVDLMKSTIVEAYAVFNRTVPKRNAYQKKLSAKFLLETDGIPLYFDNNTKI